MLLHGKQRAVVSVAFSLLNGFVNILGQMIRLQIRVRYTKKPEARDFFVVANYFELQYRLARRAACLWRQSILFWARASVARFFASCRALF